MVIIKEYRICLPLTIEEFKKGQLYAVAECSKNETGGGEGVEFVEQKSFESDELVPGTVLKGTYTYKIYRLLSKAPWILQKALPAEAFEVHEESWNAYPYCKTVITNPGYMKENMMLSIESIHLPDDGSSDNVGLHLSVENKFVKPLNAGKRDVIHVDICSDEILHKKDYQLWSDPKIFQSGKLQRQPLQRDWNKHPNKNPIMCAYKLVTINFKWTGLTHLVEKTVHKQYPRIFAKFHREAYCWLDNWIDLSMEDIRELEERTAIELRQRLLDDEKRGSACDETRNTA